MGDEPDPHYDQRRVAARIAAALRTSGVDLDAGTLLPDAVRDRRTLAVLGRAGTGKTRLLADLVAALTGAGVEVVAPEDEYRRPRGRRSVAVLAPTNKAAAVLRARGVPATTIHRILYTPLYDPDYERLADWLNGKAVRPTMERMSEVALERARVSFALHKSVPGALAAAGIRGSDFITGWKRRESPLDIGLVDEASMLDDRMLADLEALFGLLVLFGDPAQLPPVGQGASMVFDALPEEARLTLTTVHRQAEGSPILDLAHALTDEDLTFPAFERLVAAAAARDDRVRLADRADSDAMARAPVLVWRNATRIRLIDAFRRGHDAPPDRLLPGEPLVCDGLELPPRHRNRRPELEARGLVKGAQAIYLGPGRKAGYSRLHVVGAEESGISVATIIRLEAPDREEPVIASAARMGASFVHGAAVTIHKAQGSQWPEVQVFAPDLLAAARFGQVEAGTELWRRLAYVAVTRAEERLVWVGRAALARPQRALGTEDLRGP
jgi:exodeoxyribonuclease V